MFDPGIDALSILTAILPEQVFLKSGTLQQPANCDAPSAADLHMTTLTGAAVHADFDFRQTGPQTWDVSVETDGGSLRLSLGGASLEIDGAAQEVGPEREYPAMYAQFARLIDEGRSDVDRAPLRLVADAFLRCRQVQVEDFVE